MTNDTLREYAKINRYRVRNLHDGGPVPPAQWKRPKDHVPAVHGSNAEAWWGIVGSRGYVAADVGGLSWMIWGGNRLAIDPRLARLAEAGILPDQTGDREVGGRCRDDQAETVISEISPYRRAVAAHRTEAEIEVLRRRLAAGRAKARPNKIDP